jgi:hypothetical protein
MVAHCSTESFQQKKALQIHNYLDILGVLCGQLVLLWLVFYFLSWSTSAFYHCWFLKVRYLSLSIYVLYSTMQYLSDVLNYIK